MKKEKLTIHQKYILTSELELILSGGLGIADGLEIIETQSEDEKVKRILHQVREYFFAQGDLYQALKTTQAFDAYMEHMVRIGEISGHLEQVMKELVRYYEREEELRRQIKEALSYPLVLIVMMALITGVMVGKVLPVFQGVLESIGAQFSSFSSAMMNAAILLATIAFGSVLVVLLLFAGTLLYSRVKKNSRLLRAALAWFPLTRKLYHDMSLARMTFAFSLFSASGYPLKEALPIVDDTLTHPQLKEKLQRLQEHMEQGEAFDEAMLAVGLYQGMHASMLAVGVRSGHQEEVLQKLGSLYEEESEAATQHFLNIIEPTMIALLSFLVGMILLSIMLPLMGIMSTLS